MDAYLVKFNGAGIRQWGTYYGGSGNDYGYHCASDAFGNIYVAGYCSTNAGTVIATAGSHQSTYGFGGYDAFLVKFNTSGVRQWGTYYGGTGNDQGYSCATDVAGNVYMAGSTRTNASLVIATVGAHQTAIAGLSGDTDAFLVKFNTSGVRQWGTYYGGIDFETAVSCVSDNAGNVYLCGYTHSSSGIATIGSHQSVFGGGPPTTYDAFLVQFNSNSGLRQWGTYYGGTGDEVGNECAVDKINNVYMVGFTGTSTGTAISTPGSYQPYLSISGGTDAFLVQLTISGVRQWGTYYGAGSEQANSCVTSKSGILYMAGYSITSTGTVIASSGSHQPIFGGLPNTDAFLVKFFECNSPSAPIDNTPVANLAVCSNNSATLVATGIGSISWYSSISSPTAVGTGTVFVTPTLTTGLSMGTYTFYAAATNTCYESSRTPITLTVIPNPLISITGNTSICTGGTSSLNVNGSTSYTWSTGSNSTSIVVSPTLTSFYSVTSTFTNGCQSNATTTVVVNPNPTVTANTSNTLICSGQTTTLTSNGANTYSWSTSATGSVIAVSPTTTTSYSVTGTDINGCTNTSSITQSVSACTGIAETLNQNQINIYPNPATETINIQSVVKITSLKIFSVDGKLVLEKVVKENNSTLNVSELSQGIYFLCCMSDEGERYFKIIKE